MILHNLNGPKAQRRRFVYASTELAKDKTLRKLMSERYRRWVTGVDLSDRALKESDKSVEDWYNTDIKPVFDSVEEAWSHCPRRSERQPRSETINALAKHRVPYCPSSWNWSHEYPTFDERGTLVKSSIQFCKVRSHVSERIRERKTSRLFV